MPYCVKCGVELEQAAKRCPLCATSVLLPPELKQEQETALPAYPERLVIPQNTNRRFTSFILSVVLLIPNIVCVLTDFVFSPNSHWSIYVNAASVLIFLLLILPGFMQKASAYLLLSIDAAAVCLFFYLISSEDGMPGWYIPLALPLIFGLFAMLFVWAFWLKRKKHAWPSIVVAVLMCVSAYSVLLELVVTNYLLHHFSLGISLIVVASCAALSCFFIAVRQNKHLRAWLTKKFFV